MTKNPAPPSPPYVGPAARSSAGSNKPIRRIVMHSTVSPCEPGMARNIAAYFRSQNARGSAHYVVDPKEVLQVVYDSVIAWHAPPNSNSLGIELCDNPSMPASRWQDKNHVAMLALAVDLVAGLCMAYDVPPRWVGPARLRMGWRGVTDHDNVSKAFGQSSHWDVGEWPGRRAFMKAVRAEIARRKRRNKRGNR